jgi:hypothetical protein
MGARNRVGIGLSYRPARLHRLAESILWTRFMGSLKVLKYCLCTLSITIVILFTCQGAGYVVVAVGEVCLLHFQNLEKGKMRIEDSEKSLVLKLPTSNKEKFIARVFYMQV